MPLVVSVTRTWYLVTSLPFFAGAFHAMSSEPSPRPAIRTPLTGLGRVSGMTALLGPPSGLRPMAFTAATVKV